MDKRMFTLLLCACITVSGSLLLLTIGFIWPDVYVFVGPLAVLLLNALLVATFGIFVVLGLGASFSVLALADVVSGQQVVDGRYFTRCFIYRVAFLLWSLLISFAIFLMNGAPENGWDEMWPIIPALYASIALNVTTSLHVISGLAALKKQKKISGGEFASHVVLQCCFGLDFIDSLRLASRERRNHPDERVGFFRRVIVKRPLPIPVLFGALLGVCVLSSLGMLFSCLSIVGQKFMLYNGTFASADLSGKIGYLEDSSFFFFLFLFALIVYVIFDAARFYRKLPAVLMNRPFLNKVIAYASVALLLQITLFLLLLTFIGSLIAYVYLITSMNKIPVINEYCFFIAITVAAIVGVQASATFYTRLAIKRSLTDGVISDEKAKLFKRLSLIPGAQIVAVYRLIKANR